MSKATVSRREGQAKNDLNRITRNATKFIVNMGLVIAGDMFFNNQAILARSVLLGVSSSIGQLTYNSFICPQIDQLKLPNFDCKGRSPTSQLLNSALAASTGVAVDRLVEMAIGIPQEALLGKAIVIASSDFVSEMIVNAIL